MWRLQVRALAGLDHEQARAVWRAAVQAATAQGRSISGPHVASAAQELLTKPQKHLLVHLQSHSDEWLTPSKIVQLVREVFEGGRIDLDPCSTEQAQGTVQAAQFLSKADASLANSTQWRGRVFVNPPFGMHSNTSLQGQFLDKAIQEHDAGRATEVFLLLKAAIGYQWCSKVFSYPHAFFDRRIAFSAASLLDGQVDAQPRNPHGSIAVYLGQNVHRFCRVLSQVAFVPGTNSWAWAGAT